jgi:hypothetical protein
MLQKIKIKSIKKVGIEKVLDLSIPKTSNFILANNIITHNSSSYPVQKKFESKLLPGEKPTAMQIMTFRPTFFKTVRGYEELPEDNYWWTPDLTDLSELDFMTLIKSDTMTPPQQIACKEIYNTIIKRKEITLEGIYQIIDDLKDFDTRQKTSLRTKFLPLQYSQMFSTDVKGLDFERAINAGFALSLNLNGFDAISREGASLPSVMVSIWLRKIVLLRSQKKIPPVFFFLDEASRFAPAIGNPSSKLEILESYDLHARWGISWVTMTQEAQKIPEAMINQSKIYLIPYNTDIQNMQFLFKKSGVVDWAAVVYSQRCAQIKKRMKKYEWIIINRTDNDYSIIKSIAPLSMHMETSM